MPAQPTHVPLHPLDALKKALFDAYGGFADKRIKNLSKSDFFIVDDRNPGGLASDGSFYGWFCSVNATVVTDQSVRVTLGNTVPQGTPVAQWEQQHGITRTLVGSRQRPVLKFDVGPQTVDMLLSLASAFEAIVRPGAPRYSEPSYKFSCPRTAASLRRLHGVLSAHWSSSSAH